MVNDEHRELWESAGGQTPDHWKFCKIEELLESSKSISVGIMYPGSDTPGGIPLVRVADVKNGAILSKPTFCVSSKVDEEYKRTRLNGTELLITLVGNPGDCVVVSMSMAGWNAARALAVVRLADTDLRHWLRHILLSAPAKHLIDVRLNTTVQRTLNLKDIKLLGIPIPPKNERDAISGVISALDDKIELNRRMNATLEGMAQALFKSWFVDFDPVIDNALTAGNPIPEELAERAEVRRKALADGTANREAAKQFPATFQLTEEMGWIPVGWEVNSLGSLLRSVSDTYPLKTVEKVVFLNTGDILDGRFLHQDLSDTTGLPGQAKKSIQKDDILYSEIRPKNRRFAYVYFDSPKHVVSTKLMVLRATSDISSLFTYLILKQDSTINHLQMMAESRSGTFPQITFDILSKIEVALPKEEKLVSAFTENILKPIFQKQIQNSAISERLTKLRDTLLPKLISGELRIPNVEKIVAEAIV